MVVVSLCIWPGGDRARERELSVATLSLLGQAAADRPDLGVVHGGQAYRVRLFKDTQFGGPDGSGELPLSSTWRQGTVRGHLPGPRGGWDLLGGALRCLLHGRLHAYVAGELPAVGAATAQSRSGGRDG
jgi:hypothetical protein